MTAQISKLKKGFTLIELLVVIGILAILLAITLIAINPARQFAQANNTQRNSDVNAILNAIGQYAAENSGQLPGDDPVAPANNEITTTVQNISEAGADICGDLVPDYIAQLPADPSLGGPIAATCPALYDTEYQVVKSASDSRVTVSVLPANEELDVSISVTR